MNGRRYLSLTLIALWPVLIGVVLDIIDFMSGDIAAGSAWSIGGAIGVATASLPVTLTFLVLRHFKIKSGEWTAAIVGSIPASAIIAWSLLYPEPLLAGLPILLAIVVVCGAMLTGWLFSRVMGDPRDAPNPDRAAS